MSYRFYGSGTNTEKCKLLDLKLHEDSFGYYLSAKYRVEDKHSIRELDVPKIRLKIDTRRVAIGYEDGLFRHPKIDIGFGWLELNHNGTRDEIYYTETVIEEKTHEMTLDEIEKKLGYKVKIVNKKED